MRRRAKTPDALAAQAATRRGLVESARAYVALRGAAGVYGDSATATLRDGTPVIVTIRLTIEPQDGTP